MNIITGNKNYLFLKFKLKRMINFFLTKEKVIAFGNSQNQINKIFIINLDRQEKRWEALKKELGTIRTISGSLLNYSERISAVDALKANLNTDKVHKNYKIQDQYFVDPNPKLLDIIREKDVNISLTKQETAVALSHIKLWEKIVNENIENALILEDDVYFENDFSKKINLIWKELNNSKKPFDILFLSYKRVEFNPDIEEVEFSNLLIPKRGIWWFSGYVLSNKGAKTLLNRLPVVGPIDLWANHQFNEISAYLSNKSIITQKLFLSSDNNYSIMPFLSQIGIESNKTFIDLQKLKGRNPVFVFDFSNNASQNLSKINLMLSLNSYRTITNNSTRIDNFISNIIFNEETLLFDAYLGFDSLFYDIESIIRFYPNAVFINITVESVHSKGKKINHPHLLVINFESKNIFEKIGIFLKIKNWNIAKKESGKLFFESCNNLTDILKIGKHEFLEHDVTPWILPIHNIENYLPYS